MWSPGGSPRWAKGGFPVHSFVGLGLLPLGGRAGLIVGTGLCVQEGRDGSFKKKKVSGLFGIYCGCRVCVPVAKIKLNRPHCCSVLLCTKQIHLFSTSFFLHLFFFFFLFKHTARCLPCWPWSHFAMSSSELWQDVPGTCCRNTCLTHLSISV